MSQKQIDKRRKSMEAIVRLAYPGDTQRLERLENLPITEANEAEDAEMQAFNPPRAGHARRREGSDPLSLDVERIYISPTLSHGEDQRAVQAHEVEHAMSGQMDDYGAYETVPEEGSATGRSEPVPALINGAMLREDMPNYQRREAITTAATAKGGRTLDKEQEDYIKKHFSDKQLWIIKNLLGMDLLSTMPSKSAQVKRMYNNNLPPEDLE